jgi:hypothetical protein
MSESIGTATLPSASEVEAMSELASESFGTAPPLAAPPSASEVEA